MMHELVINEETVRDAPKVSTRYLWQTMLTIGAFSFGGHMALLAMVERTMIIRDQKLSRELFVRAISLASLLPGPMAVNAVTYLGHRLIPKGGAVISFAAILLPACSIMMVASWLYFDLGFRTELRAYFGFVTGTICAIICAAGYTMIRKDLQMNPIKMSLAMFAFLAIYFVPTYAMTFALIFGGLLIGVIQHFITNRPRIENPIYRVNVSTVATLLCLLLIPCCLLLNVPLFVSNIYVEIVLVFSGLSLSLFGGGYVMVPVMETLFVNDLQWLTTSEFSDAIALSQTTPGPILVSATFVGYKIAGVTGALLATLCIFAPAAMLMIYVSQIINGLGNQSLARHAMDGCKMVVVGMIFASALNILMSGDNLTLSLTTLIISLFVILKWKVSPAYMIMIAIGLGALKYNLL